MNNNSLSADFAQSKFHLELSNFLEHVKKNYPNEQERATALTDKLLSMDNYKHVIDIDAIDILNENLHKARALSVVAMSCRDFSELEGQTINDFLWVLDDLLEAAQKAVRQSNNS
jgi:hypothetical protein